MADDLNRWLLITEEGLEAYAWEIVLGLYYIQVWELPCLHQTYNFIFFNSCSGPMSIQIVLTGSKTRRLS